MAQLARPPLGKPPTRVCTSCAEEKLLGLFARNRKGENDFRPVCKDCWNETCKVYRLKKRKNQLRSEWFAIGRARSLREVEKLSKSLIAHFGGVDRVGKELVALFRGMGSSPSSSKFMNTLFKLLNWKAVAEAERDEEMAVAMGQLTTEEIVDAAIEPQIVAMMEDGQLLPILKRLVWCGKLDPGDLRSKE